MPLRIAIIGAGPAGCTLARLIQQANKDISVTIFEGESGLDFRSQGGALDLHEKTGQAALRAAGLWDEFLKYARYDGEAIKIGDKRMLWYINMGASSSPKSSHRTGGSRPEIDRPRLRQLLFESLREGTVRWDHKLLRIDDNDSGTLHFANGNVERGFDLVVGADGAWSRVRPRVSDAKPLHSGIAGHSFEIADAQRNVPDLFALVNRGSMFTFSDGKSIMVQYVGDGSLNVSSWCREPEGWQVTAGYDVHDTAAVKAAMKTTYGDWDPRLVAFIQKADDEKVVLRDLYMLPIGHKWTHRSGTTLVGDAAHLMTPFAGEGVNLAMQDSLKLSEAIIGATSTADLDARVVAFEQDMFERATATQQLTYDMMTAMYFTPGAPRSSIERYILRATEDELNPVMALLAKPIVYAWFFGFKMIKK